jgi:hypothetical protein
MGIAIMCRAIGPSAAGSLPARGALIWDSAWDTGHAVRSRGGRGFTQLALTVPRLLPSMSRRNPKAAPGFSKCRGRTECRAPIGTNLGHEVLVSIDDRCDANCGRHTLEADGESPVTTLISASWQWVQLAAVAWTATVAIGCTDKPSSSLQMQMHDGPDSGARIDAGGSDAQAVVSRQICDGSPQIRFAYGFADDRFPAVSSILYDLGSDYLYVDGTCHYWVDQPTAIVDEYNDQPIIIVDEYRYWRPVREGILTADQEVALHAAVGYDDFSQAPACPSVAADVSTARLWDGERVHLCRGGLLAPPDWPMRAELYSAASPVSGPMRIKLSTVSVSARELKYEWPLDDPAANYLVDYNSNESFRIDDEGGVQALMRLRERLIADATQTPGYYAGYIGIMPGDDVLQPGQGYALVVRDELSFTDANGQWSPAQ